MAAKSRPETPTALAHRIIREQVLHESDPVSLLHDDFMMERACELAALVGASDKRIQSTEQVVALHDEIRAAVSPELFRRYLEADEGRVADAVAHLEAGFLLGVALGRAIRPDHANA